eukprot:sb/3465438/
MGTHKGWVNCSDVLDWSAAPPLQILFLSRNNHITTITCDQVEEEPPEEVDCKLVDASGVETKLVDESDVETKLVDVSEITVQTLIEEPTLDSTGPKLESTGSGPEIYQPANELESASETIEESVAAGEEVLIEDNKGRSEVIPVADENVNKVIEEDPIKVSIDKIQSSHDPGPRASLLDPAGSPTHQSEETDSTIQYEGREGRQIKSSGDSTASKDSTLDERTLEDRQQQATLENPTLVADNDRKALSPGIHSEPLYYGLVANGVEKEKPGLIKEKGLLDNDKPLLVEGKDPPPISDDSGHFDESNDAVNGSIDPRPTTLEISSPLNIDPGTITPFDSNNSGTTPLDSNNSVTTLLVNTDPGMTPLSNITDPVQPVVAITPVDVEINEMTPVKTR